MGTPPRLCATGNARDARGMLFEDGYFETSWAWISNVNCIVYRANTAAARFCAVEQVRDPIGSSKICRIEALK